MTSEIKDLIESETDYKVCPTCDGEGEVSYFCGHYTETICSKCGGTGLIKKG